MNAVRNITVFVADDSIILRERVLALLRDIPGVDVLGCAADSRHAIDGIRELGPDVVILDIQMPLGMGWHVLKHIRPTNGTPLMIVFTNFSSAQYRKRALESGAAHFFDKTTEFENLRGLFGQLTGALEPHPVH